MADDKKKDDDELVMVGLDNEAESTDEKDSSKEKKPVPPSKDKEEPEDDDDQEEVTADSEERIGREETDVEQRRDAKRKERHEAKRRQREARDRNRLELDFLRKRNEQLERQFSTLTARQDQSEVLAVDQRINQLKDNIRTAEQVMAEAVKKAAGEDLVEATRIRDRLQTDLAKLTNAKEQFEKQSEDRRTAPPPVDPALLRLADEWRQENTWWDPNGKNEDSKIVTAIDNKLIKEDYDPTTQEYWDELTRRVKKRLPHNFEAKKEEDDGEEGDEKPERKGGRGPRFSTGGRERPLRKNEVYVSPERKAALIEAGAWEDPILRKRYLKQYQDYDREHGSRH